MRKKKAAPGTPVLAMSAGALAVSASAVFIDLSATSPGTASFYRCLLALPLLAVLAVHERRLEGGWPFRQFGLVMVAGALFAGDMLLWTQAIAEVGAGLSTVLVNAQVVIVPLLALLIDREPMHRRFLFCLPWLVLGVVLTGGVLERGVSGTSPAWGTVHAILAAICYSGFLYLLRRAGQRGHAIQSYGLVIAVAGLVSLAGGSVWRGVDLSPSWPALGWLALTALCGQVFGWLLVARASPRLSSDAGAALLMFTPIGALVLSMIVLGEHPTVLQFAGAAIMLVSAYAATSEHKWSTHIHRARPCRAGTRQDPPRNGQGRRLPTGERCGPVRE